MGRTPVLFELFTALRQQLAYFGVIHHDCLPFRIDAVDDDVVERPLAGWADGHDEWPALFELGMKLLPAAGDGESKEAMLPEVFFQCSRGGSMQPGREYLLLDDVDVRGTADRAVLLRRPVLHHHGHGCGPAAIMRLRDERDVDPDGPARRMGLQCQEQQKRCSMQKIHG